MPDQFSSEYIDYMFSDGAEVLQGKWSPKIGDCFVATEVFEEVYSDGLLEVEPGMVELLHGSWSLYDQTPQEVGRWLPTLWDLLRIIEGAGWEWSHNPGIWQAWKPTPVRGTAEKWASIKDTEDMLSAAKLAVKALGGK